VADADVEWIAENDALLRWIDRAIQEPVVAVDTESNSMHAYFERICLVQMSIPGMDVLVDALAVDLAPVGELLADPRVQKVFHGADYDVLSFKRAHGFKVVDLFDTMLAARVLGWPSYGLASILADAFKHHTDKRFQRHDWAARPMSAEAKAYARFDTHFLLELRRRQIEQLQERDRMEEFEHACARQAAVEPRVKAFDPDDFWRIKGVRELDATGRAVLRRLYVWRDALARDLDRPPFRVMGDAVLLALARARPADASGLEKVKGMPRPVLRRSAPAVLRAVAEGSSDEPPTPPRTSEAKIPRAVASRFDALRAWRKARAAELGVEPDIVIAKATLLAIAHAAPQSLADLAAIAELDDWERDRYGAEILAATGPLPDHRLVQ
jgi:ribonuclease D